tara:strand:+ start:42 stop:299 length:258 start_codon:yes stop_codon:yes gene_type:complete
MKIPATKKGCVELINDMYKEIRELEEIVAGARLNEENLLHYLTNICAIIELQMPVKYQDQFVEEMKEIGLYNPEEDDDYEVIGTA